MTAKNGMKLLNECLELVEVLTDEAVEDVLTFARLKIAMQDDKDIYISAEDWDKTPDQIKLAVASLLQFQTKVI